MDNFNRKLGSCKENLPAIPQIRYFVDYSVRGKMVLPKSKKFSPGGAGAGSALDRNPALG